jgi:hypothetical protein
MFDLLIGHRVFAVTCQFSTILFLKDYDVFLFLNNKRNFYYSRCERLLVGGCLFFFHCYYNTTAPMIAFKIIKYYRHVLKCIHCKSLNYKVDEVVVAEVSHLRKHHIFVDIMNKPQGLVP